MNFIRLGRGVSLNWQLQARLAVRNRGVHASFLRSTAPRLLSSQARYSSTTTGSGNHWRGSKSWRFNRFHAATILASAGLAWMFFGRKNDEDEFTPDEVAQHNTREKRVWVTFEDGVYDITDFIDSHPGGDVFDRVAGKSIDQDWAALTFHKEGEARKLLETMRVGRLQKSATDEVDDPFAHDPVRDYPQHVFTEKPYNSNPSKEDLAAHDLTPQKLLYNRTHYPHPKLPEDYKLSIVLPGTSITMSPEELSKRFEETTVTVVQACGGNRRATTSGTSGTRWETAVGNVAYTGVRLKSVLRKLGEELGYDEEDLQEMFIQTTGYDHSPSGTHYDSAIGYGQLPEDALLAYRMNGEALTPDHGYPLRLVVPGKAGHMWVKYPERMLLVHQDRIQVLPQFKDLPPDIAASLSLSSAQRSYVKYDAEDKVIGFAGELPVQSDILRHHVSDSLIKADGYAHSGGGRGIKKEEVTWDNGKTWHDVEVTKLASQPEGAEWAWVRWQFSKLLAELPPEAEKVCFRATDSDGNSQPLEVVFNKRGLDANACPCISIRKKTDLKN